VQSAVQQTGESGCEQGTESRRLCARERNVEDTATLVVAQCRLADTDQWEAERSGQVRAEVKPQHHCGADYHAWLRRATLLWTTIPIYRKAAAALLKREGIAVVGMASMAQRRYSGLRS
jgi:hypothetical protein